MNVRRTPGLSYITVKDGRVSAIAFLSSCP